MNPSKKAINDEIRQVLGEKVCDSMREAAGDAMEEVLGGYVGRFLKKKKYESCLKDLWFEVAYIVDHDIRKIFEEETLLEEYLK